MKNIRAFIFAWIFILGPIVAAISQEKEMRSIDTILSDIRKDQGVKGSEKIDPDKVSPALLDELGDALMDRMIGNEDRHKIMDQMMGGEGSSSLTAMHQRIAYNYISGNGIGSGYGGMMGWNYGSGRTGYGMMGGNYGNGGMMGDFPETGQDFDKPTGKASWMADWLDRFITLTSEQREKITDVYKSLEKEVEPLNAQILEKRRASIDLWKANGTLNENAILKADKAIYDLLFQVNEKEILARISVYKIFTPEQRSKFDNWGMMGWFPLNRSKSK